MLNRDKFVHQVTGVADKLFKKQRSYTWLTKQLWQSITCDDRFLERVKALQYEKRLVSWRDDLSHIIAVTDFERPYAVVGVDGSQIYPDRHMEGVECFLINVGGIYLAYGDHPRALFFSDPFIYVPEQCAAFVAATGFSAELVDLVREGHEFEFLYKKAIEYAGTAPASDSFLALFDGNLLLWHLESKTAAIQDIFMERYLAPLHGLYQHKILYAGYLSAAQSRDLVYLVAAGLKGDTSKRELVASLDELNDASMLAHVLELHERTTVFYCNSAIVEMYPAHLKPCFFYLHVDGEIVRIEIPCWIAQSDDAVNAVAKMCIDQTIKGYGYPVALAEAHAQAVVQSADRDFFYHYIQRLAMQRQHRIKLSAKSFKKRIMSM